MTKRKYKSIPEQSATIIAKFKTQEALTKFINSQEYQGVLGELINIVAKYSGNTEYFTHPSNPKI